MKSKNIPDRVHVVRPPENDSYAPRDSQTVEVVRMLAQISDKLKRSEAERYELLAEMREYRKSLSDLEDRSENAEKSYFAVENKFKSAGTLDSEHTQRQLRFEKSLKSTEDKMLKSIAGQAVMDKRLRDTEDKQTMIDQRLDQSVVEQARLSRQIEISMQDKARMLRKVERLEEMMLETQDALRAKAMVLLTDQSKNQQTLSAPVWSNLKEEVKPAEKKLHVEIADEEEPSKIDWKKLINVQSVSTAALITAAILLGWSIMHMQSSKPDAVDTAQSSTMINNDIASFNGNTKMSGNVQNASVASNPVPDNVMDYSDDQLMEAFNEDPDQLAAQLNGIEPAATDAGDNTQATAIKKIPAITEPNITPEMANFDKVAYTQDPNIIRAVAAEISNRPLLEQIQPDANLPTKVKRVEEQAFKGNAEAQHDLAALYTAGQEGVVQNFERAAFWFRQASEQKIPNAQYNLGVLYHQGLGRARDLSLALYWYREAAKLGHAEAQYNLGIAHIEGIGTEYNPKLAAAFFERAANNGIMEAAYNLGLIYDNGLIGQTKPDEALLWYKIAADQGSKEAKAAMEQLAKSLQIDMNDINNLVDRMQIINESVKGRRAGPDSNQKNVRANNSSTFVADNALVTQIQEYLMLTGAYAGPSDGVNGTATQDSIRAYQAANNLPVDGQISEALLNSMVGGAIERLNNR